MERNEKKFEIIDQTSGNRFLQQILGALFGLIQIILIFRLAFSMFAANRNNAFVKLIYNLTDWFVSIFENIFSPIKMNDSGTMIFEPATLIAILVVLIVASFIMAIIPRNTKRRIEREIK